MSYTTILKGIAKANKVKISDLTKKMIQKAPIPVRYKKFLQGQTLGEARMAKTLKSHRGVVPMELKALGIGLAAGNAATKLVDAMWSTRPTGLDDKLKKRSNTITAADRKSAMEKQAARKRANRDLEQAKDKRLKGDVENATAPKPKPKKKLVAKKDQGKGGKFGDGSTAVKKSLRPKARPFKDGGMPMVMKNGKKVPAFAADGVGKMNKGGMAKKKPTAKKKATAYMYGGMAKKKAKK
jgi:hypothetical protein